MRDADHHVIHLSAASPFLLGRALWAASRFTAAMSPELIQQFLQATVSGLHESQPPSVRISAVRAIWGYFAFPASYKVSLFGSRIVIVMFAGLQVLRSAEAV